MAWLYGRWRRRRTWLPAPAWTACAALHPSMACGLERCLDATGGTEGRKSVYSMLGVGVRNTHDCCSEAGLYHMRAVIYWSGTRLRVRGWRWEWADEDFRETVTVRCPVRQDARQEDRSEQGGKGRQGRGAPAAQDKAAGAAVPVAGTTDDLAMAAPAEAIWARASASITGENASSRSRSASSIAACIGWHCTRTCVADSQTPRVPLALPSE